MLPGGAVDIAAAGAATEVGVRPEHLSLSRSGQIAGTLLAAEHLGSDTFAYVDVEGLDRPLMVRLAGAARLPSGEAVRVAANPAQLHLFDASGRTLPQPGAALAGVA